MANFFDQFDGAPKAGNFFDQFDAKPAAPKEESGFLRQVADVPLSIGKGAATGVRMIADAFGAGSGASEAIKGVEDYLSGLMSAQAKNDEREIARIMKDAEDKGVLDQVKAGFKAFSVAPVDLLSQGLGTAAPAILGVLGGKVLGAGALGMSAIGTGVGAGMGAGSAKGGIYEEVKAALKEAKVDDAKAEQVAIEAQKYGGKNMDQILLSAGLGGLAGRFGLESSAKRMLTGAVGKEAGKSAAREMAEGAARTAVTESVPELLQGSQEQVAKNIALQREGFDVPTMRGVAGSGTLEALAGAGLGAVTGGAEAGLRSQARGEADRILAEEQKVAADAEQARLDAEAAKKAEGTKAIEDQAAEVERQQQQQQQRQQAAMERARAGGIGGGSEVNQTMLEQARIRKEQQERAAAAEEKAAEAERQRALRAERARIGGTQYSADPMMNEVLRSRAIANFDAANAPKAEAPKPAPEYQPTKTIEQTTPIEQPKDFNVLRGVDARNADLMSAVAERRAAQEAAAATQAKTTEAKKAEQAAKVDTSRADVDQRVAQVENFLMSPVKKTQQETADYMAGVVPEMQKDFMALFDEDMNQPLTPEQTEALKTQIRQRLQPDFIPEENVQRTPFKRFLASKGMNKKDVQDIFGENAYRANQQLPGAIRADGPRLDMLAEAAVEAGFLQNEDTEALVDMIKAEFGGDEQVSVDMSGDRAAAEYEAQRESELESRAAVIGLKTKGMTPDQIAARLDRIERKREEKRKQYSRNVDGFADLPTAEQDRIIDMMIDQFGEPQVFDVERAEIEGRVREEEELLQTQSEKQLRDKQAEIDRLEKENERLSKEAERKAKADEQVGDFVLTGSKRDADEAEARGQEPMFAAETGRGYSISAEDQRIEKELTGKSMIQASDWAVANAPNAFAKVIAEKTRNRLREFQRKGMTLEFNISGGSSRPRMLSGARGVTQFDWGKEDKGTKITVTLNGAAAMDNQAGYPPGVQYNTILHELLHVATRSQFVFMPNTDPLKKQMTELFNAVVGRFNADAKAGTLPPVMEKYYKRMNNVLEDPDELLAWGLTDKDVQAYFDDIKVGEKSVFTRLVELIRTALGLGKPYESALERLVRTSESLLDVDVDAIDAMLGQRDKQIGVKKKPAGPMTQESLFQKEGVAAALRAQGIRTGFYSQLQRSIADVPDRIANQPAQQWKAWLASNAPKLGIKKEEIEWSGINDYLDLRGKEKITKDDLQSYLKDNGVKVSEVLLGGDATKSDLMARQVSEMSDSELRNLPGSDYFEPEDWLIFRDGDNFVGQLNGSASTAEEAVSTFREEASAEGYEGVLAEGESRYGRYTLPGGENYREVLITLPSKNPVAGVSPVQAARILYNKEYAQLSPDQQADVKERISDEKSPSPYLSSHWSEPNVVAHVRVNDRTDADGNRVLFVEEIQSDWGQKGKSEGFKGSIDAALKANNMTRKEFDSMPPEDQQFAIDETRRMSLPSAAPFITKTEGWLNLALKRIAMMAVEGGYDKVAFINGAQSHARFPKKANGESTEESFKAFYDQIVPQEINKLLPKLGGNSLDMVKFASGEKKPVPPKSEIVSVLTQYGRGNLSNEEVRDELGVDVSDIELEEVDLSDPYDRGRGMGVIRDLAAEIIARNAAQKKMKQSGFDVTPSMRETVGAGVPMFQREGQPNPTRQNIFGEPVLGTWSITVDPKMELQDGLIYKMLDKNIDVKRIVEAVKNTGKEIASRWNPYLQEELYHGRTANASQEFQDKEWLPLLQDMDKKGVTIGELEKYLLNRHAEDYNKLMAQRNPDRPEMQDGASSVNTADARKYLASLDKDTKAKYDELAKRIDGITKGTRQLLADTGYEKAKTIKTWEEMFPNYVPLMREEEDFDYNFASFGTGRGFDVRRDFSRSAMGSKRNVVDIIGNVISARNQAIALTEKNRVAQAVYGLALEAPNPDFWLPINPDLAEVREVDRIKQNIAKYMAKKSDPNITDDELDNVKSSLESEYKKLSFAKTKATEAIERVRRELVDLGIPEETINTVMQEPEQRILDPKKGQVVKRVNTKLRENDHVLATRINGEKRYVFFNPKDPRSKRAATALKNLDAQDLGTALGLIAKVTRWMASVNTQYNPIFGPYNFLRDVQSAALQLSTTELAGQQKEIAANVVPSLRAIYSSLRKRRKGDSATGEMADLWKEFQKEGGQTGFKDNFSRTQDRTEALLNEMEKITEGKVKANARAVFDWLSDYNDSLENAVRLSAYKVAKEKFAGEGFSDSEAKQKAASLAKNLTVNFNRKGDWATQMGSLYAFFNASMQGTARMIETLKGPTGRKIIAGGLLLGGMQAALLAAAGFDDDEPPEFIRSKNIVIPTGDGDYVAFPMPLGFHVIPGVSRILTEWTLSGFKDTARRTTDLTGLFLDAFNPIGNAGWSVQTITPTILDPLVALGENKDWTGKPISKEDLFSLRPTPGYTRAREGANVLSTSLAEFLNLASGGTKRQPGVLSPTPEQIEYLVGQAFGGVGREAMKLATTIEKTTTGEELPPYKIPLYGRFVGETKSSAAESNKFYKNMERLNRLDLEIKGRREDKEPIGDFMRENPEARLLPMANKTYKDVQELRKRRKALLERDAPRESIQAVEKQITRRMQVLNDRVKALEESSN